MTRVLSAAAADRIRLDARAHEHIEAIEALGWELDAIRPRWVTATKREREGDEPTRVGNVSLAALRAQLEARPTRSYGSGNRRLREATH